MPVHRRTHMYIKNVPTQGYFPFPQAQVLTILCASSPSLPFYFKVDWTGNNVASDALFISFFLSVAWSTTAQLITFFCFRFPKVLFGSPGHDLHLSSIRWISCVLSLSSSWFWNVIYLFTILINWRVQGLSCETTTTIMFCNTSETYPTKSWKLPR